MAAFGSHAEFYNDHAHLYSDPIIRPMHPPEVFEKIYHFAGESTDVALDVATGTGQCARELAKRYKQVWAIDASEEQVKQCKSDPGVTFSSGLAEKTGLPDSSVDLITTAAALHWLDVAAFYLEARRVLKPGGALAAWTYYLPRIAEHDTADEVLRNFFHNTLGPYKAEAHFRCERKYRGLEPGQDEFGVVEWDELAFDHQSSIWHLVQFIRTSGLYGKMLKESPGQPDPLPALKDQLMAALNTSDEKMRLTLDFPVFMMLAKDPQPL